MKSLPFSFEFTVGEDAIDQNNHVNNVVYIQWMQDVAIRHSEECGGIAAMHEFGCSWYVRSHQIEYLHPAKSGDDIIILTWVANFSKVRSLRKYKFMRKADDKILAIGETDWVYVNGENGRPQAIPDKVKNCYPLLSDFT